LLGIERSKAATAALMLAGRLEGRLDRRGGHIFQAKQGFGVERNRAWRGISPQKANLLLCQWDSIPMVVSGQGKLSNS
jgi:hypothetical protein